MWSRNSQAGLMLKAIAIRLEVAIEKEDRIGSKSNNV